MIYKKGDLVQVRKFDKIKDSHISHFKNDCRAIVLYSYSEKCLYTNTEEDDQYGLFIEGCGRSSWYFPKDFTLIKRKQYKLLNNWEEQLKQKEEQLEKERKGKEGKYFSGFQIMCMSGRCQDECEVRNLDWDKVKHTLADIVNENQKDGNADYGICHTQLFEKIDELDIPDNKIKLKK